VLKLDISHISYINLFVFLQSAGVSASVILHIYLILLIASLFVCLFSVCVFVLFLYFVCFFVLAL
jgi:hypothetical protein